MVPIFHDTEVMSDDPLLFGVVCCYYQNKVMKKCYNPTAMQGKLSNGHEEKGTIFIYPSMIL